MKIFKRILLSLIVIVCLGIIGIYFYLNSTKPQYKGELTLEGINKEIKIYFDEYGIPHIYAQNEEDAYFALGYVYAQDRLFQTELLKRLASGRLSELLGKDLVKTDKYMRVLGLREAAKNSASKYMSTKDKQYQKSFYSYQKGFNKFVNTRNLPIEYKILGIPKENLTPTDSYSIVNFIALGFSMPVVQESISAYIYKKYGKKYLDDFYFGEKKGNYLPYEIADTNAILYELSLNNDLISSMNKLNLSIWEGSNSWVISSKKSKSGKVIFANDTHFAYSQPAVWYEAEITYPGYNFYGLYLPGVPFPVIGHSKDYGWGLTIFPLDNANYYEETIDSNRNKVLYKNEWVDLQFKVDTIKVKGADDIVFKITKTPHGPVINSIDKTFSKEFKKDISLWWVLQRQATQQIEALYNMSRATDLNDFEKELSKIDILGLNVMYGDSENNIAFWGTGKLPFYNKNINPFTLLNGADGTMEIDSFYPFSENPHVINPKTNYVATANNDPILSGYSKYFPGHYLPTNRINMINNSLSEKDKWEIEDVKELQLNHKSLRDEKLAKMISEEISNADIITTNPFAKSIYNSLSNWNGEYNKDSKAPIIYSKLQYYINKYAILDELGEEIFKHISKSYLLKSSIERLYMNKKSPWWDIISTKENIETRQNILIKAFEETVVKLEEEWGKDINNWNWEDAHQLTFRHPFSQKKPLNKIFDVGAFKMPSCPGCINKMSFPINNDKIHQIGGGPAMRTIIDFADVKNALNVLPTGQSGNIMSPHYDDQSELFTSGKYRKMIMDDININKSKNVLTLKPKS